MKRLMCFLSTLLLFITSLHAYEPSTLPPYGTHRNKGLMIAGISCAGAGAMLGMGGLLFYGSNSSSRGSNTQGNTSYSRERHKSSLAEMEGGVGLLTAGCVLMAIDAANHNKRKKWWAIVSPTPSELGLAWNFR